MLSKFAASIFEFFGSNPFFSQLNRLLKFKSDKVYFFLKLRSSIKAGSELEKLAGRGIFSSRSEAVAIGKLSGIRGDSASFSISPPS